MNAPLVVAVGTTRAPKLRAVENTLRELRERFPGFLPGELKIEARRVASGVPATPTTTEQTMRGARERAEAVLRSVRDEGAEPALGIGLEGGLAVENGTAYLHSWAYAVDGETGYFGSSGALPIPTELSDAVLIGGEDLGAAADRYFERREVAAQEGTFGVLTRNMVSREEAFTRALLHALAPFYNPQTYGRGP